MRRLIGLLLCAVLLYGAFVAGERTARAATITVAAQAIPYWPYATDGSVYLQIRIQSGVVVADGTPLQPSWRKRIPVMFTSSTDPSTGEVIVTATIKQFSLPSTTDGQDTGNARYTAEFVDADGNVIAPYYGFESFRVQTAYATSPATWAQIRLATAAPVPYTPATTYTTQQIDLLISQAIASASGIQQINGLTSTNQTFVAGTNVSVTSTGSSHTFAITGQVGAANGGTGLATVTTNGVPYGNGTGALGVTAAPGAYSILAGNSGPPAFTQTPQINTSLTLGNSTIQSGSLIFRNASNSFTTTVTAGAPASNQAFRLPLADGTSGQFLTTDGSGNWSFATPTGTISGSGTSARVTFWSGASAITSDSNFLFDTAADRLSLGTTLSAETLNLPISGYVGGVDITGIAVRKLVGSKSASRITSSTGAGLSISYGTTAVSSVDVAPDTVFIHNYTEAGAATLNPLLSYYQPAGSNGMKLVHAVTGSFDDSTSENIYSAHFTARNEGTTPTVALTALALTNSTAGTAGQIIGSNVIAYHEAPNGSTLTNGYVVGQEINYGYLGTVTIGSGQQSVGLQIIPYGSAQVGSYIALASGTVAAQPATAIQLTVAGGVDPIANGGRIFGLNASFGTNTLSSGFDLAGAEYSLGAFKAAYGLTNGLFANNSGNTTAYNLISLGTDATMGVNTVRVGQASVGNGISIYAGNAAETLKLTSLNRAGLNTSGVTLAHALTVRPTKTRALTGTVATTAGLPTVDGSGTQFLQELRPGNTIVINGVAYQVATIAANTGLSAMTLTTNAASTLSGQAATADDPMFLIENDQGTNFVEVDGLGTLILYDRAATSSISAGLQDAEGALQIRSRTDSSDRLVMGWDSTNGHAFISSITVKDYAANALGYGNLIINGGATTGYVGIGTAQPTALLTVQGSGPKSADFIGSQFNNVATSSSTFTKVGAAYTLSGSWVGAVRGLQVNVTDSLDTAGNKTGYAAVLHGDGVLVAPPQGGGSTIFAPTANLHVYGHQSTAVAGTAADAITFGVTNSSPTVAGVGTTFTSLEPGQVVRVSTDTSVYTIASIASATSMTLTTNYGGTTGNYGQAWAEPPLLKLTNGAGTDRFTVTSAGRTTVNGKFVTTNYATAIASAATIDVTNTLGSAVHVTGTTTISTINGGIDGWAITLVFDGACTVDEAGNVLTAGASFAGTANSTLTLRWDATANKWLEVGRMVN